MKFFWKIFFAAVAVSVAAFSTGSLLLIQSVFQDDIGRETQASIHENETLRSVFLRDASGSHSGKVTLGAEPSEETLARLAQTIKIVAASGTVPISVSNSDCKVLYSSSGFSPDRSMLKSVPAGSRGTALLRQDDRRYVAAVSAVAVDSRIFYLANYHEVTALFSAKAEQLRMLERIMLTLIFVSGALIFVIALYLTRPVTQLSQAAKRMARGDFTVRLNSRSDDEIGMLSRDFDTMADQLEKNIQELKEASERQESFLASFAHELKTPLTAIIGYADMIRSKKMTEEQRFEAATYIFQEGNRLESLSFKLMEMILLKKQDFPLNPVQAATLFESVRGAVAPTLQAQNLSLVLAAEDAVLFAEPNLLETVLVNLIDNARKASFPGGEIRVEGMRVAQGYRIAVCDRGRGIPKEDLPKITEAFYMVDKSRARAEGGAGLGLALCAAIVALHHGEMEFESEPGKGTRVTILLKEAAP